MPMLHTAAYEPYRRAQAAWLKSAVDSPEVSQAALRVAVCHIPLRGRPGDNDGTTEPVTQVVGGGPQPDRATVTILKATPAGMEIRVEDLAGRLLQERTWRE